MTKLGHDVYTNIYKMYVFSTSLRTSQIRMLTFDFAITVLGVSGTGWSKTLQYQHSINIYLFSVYFSSVTELMDVEVLIKKNPAPGEKKIR